MSGSVAAAATVAVNGDVSLSSSTYNVSESSGSVTITATRSGGTTGALSVTYKTVAETALAGQQFTTESGTLSWASGDASSKTFTIPILKGTAFTGTKYFYVRLTAGANTILGSRTSTTVTISGGSAPVSTKSVKEWVSCSETIDESQQLSHAITAAANNAFTLIVDCPVRFHTGTAASSSIAVPDGVTIQFTGAGEFLVVSNGPPALSIAHPTEVTFVDWNLTYL